MEQPQIYTPVGNPAVFHHAAFTWFDGILTNSITRTVDDDLAIFPDQDDRSMVCRRTSFNKITLTFTCPAMNPVTASSQVTIPIFCVVDEGTIRLGREADRLRSSHIGWQAINQLNTRPLFGFQVGPPIYELPQSARPSSRRSRTWAEETQASADEFADAFSGARIVSTLIDDWRGQFWSSAGPSVHQHLAAFIAGEGRQFYQVRWAEFRATRPSLHLDVHGSAGLVGMVSDFTRFLANRDQDCWSIWELKLDARDGSEEDQLVGDDTMFRYDERIFQVFGNAGFEIT